MRNTLAFVSAVALLFGCAKTVPEPIAPEPIYDKYGNEILGGGGGQCRDGGRLDSYVGVAAYAAAPICANTCAQGYTTTRDGMQCVPINRDGGDSDNTGRQPTTGKN